MQVGKNYQWSQDEPKIVSLENDYKNLSDHVAEKEHRESARTEFLQDLRLHLPADAEVEQLFKPGDFHTSKDLGSVASAECCKAETHKLVQLFQKGKTDNDPLVTAIGGWLHVRCSDYFPWLRR